jgi:hypothetical protein
MFKTELSNYPSNLHVFIYVPERNDLFNSYTVYFISIYVYNKPTNAPFW